MLHYILLGSWPSTLLKVSWSHFSTIFYNFLFSNLIYIFIKYYMILQQFCLSHVFSLCSPCRACGTLGQHWHLVHSSYINSNILCFLPLLESVLPLFFFFFNLLFMFHPIIYFTLLQNYHFVWRLYNYCNAFSVDILQYQILHFLFTF